MMVDNVHVFITTHDGKSDFILGGQIMMRQGPAFNETKVIANRNQTVCGTGNI